ncbi:MAG: SRPBCC family protein [Rhodobacteraceae bacterium]|nr:SRPBCC family protein [Paracoccaceae bacterium]
MSDLDLTLTRHMAVAPERVWRAWTEPDLMRRWFAPAPVETRAAVIDLRPGGRFHVLMVAPDGTEYPNEGCILLVEPGRRLIFTECLTEGFRPVVRPVLPLTAEILIEPDGSGTRYTARALHGDAATRDEHAEKGFEMGWGLAAEQLEATARAL